jgi:hypothetical protein
MSAGSRLKIVLSFEVTIGRLNILLLNVFHDYFIRHVTGTGHEIPTSPYVPTPKRTTQTLEFHHHLARRLPFDRLNQMTNGNMRRHRHQYMHMITRNMALDDFNILRPANLTGQFPNPLGYVSAQNRLAVFRDPNNVIFDIINGMARLPIVLHTASILKSSPEGEGFSPNPRRGQ